MGLALMVHLAELGRVQCAHVASSGAGFTRGCAKGQSSISFQFPHKDAVQMWLCLEPILYNKCMLGVKAQSKWLQHRFEVSKVTPGGSDGLCFF